VKKLKANTICFTHYGPTHEAALEEAARDLREWDATLRPLVLAGAEEDELLRAIEPQVGIVPGDAAFSHAASELSSNMNSVLGFLRYYRKNVLPQEEA